MTARSALALVVLTLAAAVPAAGASVTFVVGLSGPESAHRSVKGIAAGARRVLETTGSSVEVRGTGQPDFDLFESGAPAEAIEASLLKASPATGATSAEMLTALDAAAQGLRRKPGGRVLVALFEQQPLGTETERRLSDLIAYCRESGVRVLVVDPSQSKSKAAPLKKLAELSGGAITDNPKGIGSQIATLLAAPSHGQGGAPVEPEAAITAGLPAMPSDFPVEVRFLQTGSSRSRSWGTERHHSSGGPGGGITTTEGGANTESTTGPAHGMLLVEAPMSSLYFEVDDHSGTYLAKARVTQVVRAASGREVWRASKEVSIRGPLDKLKARKSGSIYYMRDVTLPAGRYVIEGTVEDLQAHKGGGARAPLGTPAGLPGFNLSDAMIVRPFKSATDRFEADQVLSYDGEALAPMLSPVFQADQPVDLRIFLILYPDLNGGQPQLSLELLEGSQVVGRMALPFTDQIKDTAREGRGATIGEQKHQFPYMATIRGAKFPRGEYEGRVIVRQGGNVLSRSVRFRVEGPAAGGKEKAAEAGGSSPAPAEEDLSTVVLPQIDAAELDRSGPGPEPGEVTRLWEEAAARAGDFSAHLPNFRCIRETRRLTAPARASDSFKESDVVVSELAYEDGKESTNTVSVNGTKADGWKRAHEGVFSRGEFGTLLRGIFSTKVAAGYKWAGRSMAGGALCRVFEVEVPAKRSNFVLTHKDAQVAAAYKGRVYIEEESGLVSRISIEGVDLPKKFGLQSPSMSLDYGLVKIGDADYLLPLRSVLQTRWGKTIVRNVTVFRDYHKFDAKSLVVY